MSISIPDLVKALRKAALDVIVESGESEFSIILDDTHVLMVAIRPALEPSETTHEEVH